MPTLWVDGTNDVNYPFEVLKKSYDLVKGPKTLVTRVRMKHSHSAGWAPGEIYAYADSMVKGGKGLAEIMGVGVDAATINGAPGLMAWVRCDGEALKSIELNYTTDSGDWKKRKWQAGDPSAFHSAGKDRVPLPGGATAWFFNLTDERGLMVSSELQIVK